MQRSVLFTTVGVLGIVVALAAIFSTIGKWLIAWSFSIFGSALTFITGMIARPIMYVLGLLDWTFKPRGQEDESSITFQDNDEVVPEAVVEQGSIFDNPLVLATILLIIVTVLYFILKKKKVMKDLEEHAAQPRFYSSLTRKNEKFGFSRNKQKPPENQVRRLMFDLEKLALKKKRGRFPHETLEDWLNRETFLKQEFMQLYAKVRYGELNLSPEELVQCREMAEELRKILKLLKKAG